MEEEVGLYFMEFHNSNQPAYFSLFLNINQFVNLLNATYLTGTVVK